MHFDYAPFSSLLKYAAALVHHGGIGTTSQARWTGVPHLVGTCVYDQGHNAQRLVDLGVAETVERKRYHVSAPI
ncbi:MAG: nucleotide disphospho-sugar-binding domain-containing protein [Gemmatimonadota bacterium]|nr:nucleotide disphospho-sugar-binding domain-containing protein [Gemmatimonadota bacterium]